jgi:hypothetical protein
MAPAPPLRSDQSHARERGGAVPVAVRQLGQALVEVAVREALAGLEPAREQRRRGIARQDRREDPLHSAELGDLVGDDRQALAPRPDGRARRQGRLDRRGGRHTPELRADRGSDRWYRGPNLELAL